MVDEAWSADEIIARLGADEALARELAALFVAECPRMMTEVRTSVASGAANEIRKSAHALKGSVANFTDGAPMRAALALEMMARANDVAGTPAALQDLEHAMAGFVAQLELFIGS
jgi:HPt (histidine-containing phosphotransfer) domain-containing protein